MSEENKQETVAGIVAEMRRESDNRMEDASCYTECALLRDYADRIEAANQREVARLREEAQRDIEAVGCKYSKLVARLRAALRPVLDVDMTTCINILPRCTDAVRESRRIYSEGGEDK